MIKKSFKKLFFIIMSSFSIHAAYKEYSQTEDDTTYKDEIEGYSDQRIVRYIRQNVIKLDDTIICSAVGINDNVTILIDLNSCMYIKFSKDNCIRNFLYAYHQEEYDAIPLLLKFNDQTLISAVDQTIKIWHIDFEKLIDTTELSNAFQIKTVLKCPYSSIKNIKKVDDKFISVHTKENHIILFDIINGRFVKELDNKEKEQTLSESEKVIKEIIELEKQHPSNKFKDKEYEIKLLLKITEDIYATVIDNKECSDLNFLHITRIWDIKKRELLNSIMFQDHQPIIHLAKINDNMIIIGSLHSLTIQNINSSKFIYHVNWEDYKIQSIYTTNDVIFILSEKDKVNYLDCLTPIYSDQEQNPIPSDQSQRPIPKEHKKCVIL